MKVRLKEIGQLLKKDAKELGLTQSNNERGRILKVKGPDTAIRAI